MSRLDLHTLLSGLTGVVKAYYQPPETVKMEYPCIVYSKSNENVWYSDNDHYNDRTIYQVMVIDPDPDSLIPSEVSKLPLCSFVRRYTKNNLNHDVYSIYY